MRHGFVKHCMFRIVEAFFVWTLLKLLPMERSVHRFVTILVRWISRNGILRMFYHWCVSIGASVVFFCVDKSDRRCVCLHLIKNRWWDEDKHYFRRSGLGEVWECLLNRSLGLLRFLGKKEEPLTAVSEQIACKPKNILKRLGLLG
jgi:hypothetical protein